MSRRSQPGQLKQSAPETELQSHYFEAVLPEQFDAYVWFEQTQAVTPLATADPHGTPETFPFGV